MDENSNYHEAGQNEDRKTVTEEFHMSGETLTVKIRELLREGNVRRIILKNDEGKTLIEIPLTAGVVGTLLLPVWAGVGAIAALAANLTLSVERRIEDFKMAETSSASDKLLDKAPSNSSHDSPTAV